MATRPNGEQGWQCQVCSKYFTYSQPINFHLAAQLAKVFMDWHAEHCKAPEARKEVPSEH